MSETRRLYRSRSDKILCGVCGGVASYVRVDPTIVRLLWVAITVLSPPLGLILYIVACLIIPEEPGLQQPTTSLPSRLEENVEERILLVIGIILLLVGGLIITSVVGDLVKDFVRWGSIAWVDERLRGLAGIVLVIVGLVLILKLREKQVKPAPSSQQSL
jgi:phage shock protein PspC (stress-responsive transcriptional regulator)